MRQLRTFWAARKNERDQNATDEIPKGRTLSRGAAGVVAKELMLELGETDTQAFKQLRHVVRVFGAESARLLIAEARAIFLGDGMLVEDGSRKRTLGGVYFVLAKERLTAKILAGEWVPRWARVRILWSATSPKPAPSATSPKPAPSATSPKPAPSPLPTKARRRTVEVVTLRRR